MSKVKFAALGVAGGLAILFVVFVVVFVIRETIITAGATLGF